jgi:hypothetical protein
MSGKISQKIDTNINNYTLVDLLTILEIDVPTVENVTESTERYIRKYESENNQTMVFFFTDIRDSLLVYVNELKSKKDAEYADARAEYNLWWNSQQVLPQTDQVQKDKITERRNNATTFSNQYFPMNSKQLGVTNVKNVDVAQDTLNPNLTNTTNRIISLDSQYRQVTGISSPSTDYTLDLNEPLLNVLSLRPYSFQVPYTWYTVDIQNSCFFITLTDGENTTSVTISLQYGNYSTTSFIEELTTSLTDAGFTFSSTPASFNSINGKITLYLYGGTYVDGDITYTIDDTTVVTFFDPSNELSCYNGPCLPTTVISHTLGWLMGFRLPFINVYSDGNEAVAILSLSGPKYLIVVLDDFNQNHINGGLIGIDQLSKTLKLPTYYSRDLPYVCTPADPTGTNIKTNTVELANNVDAGTLIMDKWNATYVPTVKVLPSAPRILTKSQIYSINEILKNNSRYSNAVKTSSPSCTDTFAIIPLDKKNMTTGEIYVEDSSTLQLNKRIYFGPVNIDRFHLKLLDDRGNLLNLNGGEWCMTIIAEVLYQY